VPSRPALPRRPLLETYDSIIIREGTPSFTPSRQDPQVSSIAPYERPVFLQSEVGELALMPIEGTGSRLLLPFRLRKGTATIAGELVLADHDPLPLLISGAVPHYDAIRAWSCALLGFADAGCVEMEPAEAPVRRQPSHRLRPGGVGHAHGVPARSLPRKQTWPSHLMPIGGWIRCSGSFVAGHRRRLNDGRRASAEARERANHVGITLQPNETWVRSHARGVPAGVEMRFRWRAPSQLREPFKAGDASAH
jgi:hypothetical protein